MKLAPLMLCLACLAAAAPAGARPHHAHWPRYYYTRQSYWRAAPVDCDHLMARWPIIDDSGERTWRGRLKRSRVAREAFQCQTPCPSTGLGQGACPGYVVDHIVPLKRGGADLPENMQWQTDEEAKAKDKVE